jgi:sec-independent protein translocase protein TatA
LFNIGPTELIVIVIIALIVFGPRRLPEIGRTVGKSMREFRKASQDLRDEFNFNLDDAPGDRPAPGEPGYANWQPGQRPASVNGGSESSNGSTGDSAGPELGLGVVAGSGAESSVEPGGEGRSGGQVEPVATTPVEAGDQSLDDPAPRDDAGTEAAG